MARFVFFALIAAFFIGATPTSPAFASDRVGQDYDHEIGSGAGCVPNENGKLPSSCSAGTVAGNSSPSSKLSTTEWVMISVGVGLAVTAVVAYFWHKKPSENNPGQIALMSF